MKRPSFTVQMDSGHPEILWENGIAFSVQGLRVEVGSDLTADPNSRPSRIVIDTGSTIAHMVCDLMGIPPLRAPPRDEFLKRLEAIEENLRLLVASSRRSVL